MKSKFFFILTPLLSVNTLFVLLDSCGNDKPCQCGYYTKAALTAMDNADSIPRQPDLKGVRAKAFLLALTLWDTAWTCKAEHPIFPANAALATYLGCATPATAIDYITITSSNDYDPSHPAGTDLKDVFSINSTNTVELHPGNNNFYLRYLPADTGTHIFTVRLLTADSSKNLTAISLPVKLLL